MQKKKQKPSGASRRVQRGQTPADSPRKAAAAPDRQTRRAAALDSRELNFQQVPGQSSRDAPTPVTTRLLGQLSGKRSREVAEEKGEEGTGEVGEGEEKREVDGTTKHAVARQDKQGG